MKRRVLLCPVDRCEWGRQGLCIWQSDCPHQDKVDAYLWRRVQRQALAAAARRRMEKKCQNAEWMARMREERRQAE